MVAGHMRSELSQLRTQVSYLQKRNSALLDKSAQLGRAGEIDREAMRRVQAMLNQMQGKLADLTEEVSFYRSIVSPHKLKPGLHLQHFQITGGQSKQYRYRLVLTQVQDKHRVVKGKIAVQILGQMGGKAKTLDLNQMGAGTMDFSFRYFHAFSGGFALPAGFTPEQIDIRVTPFTRHVAGVEQKVSWKQATSMEG
ncbi:hypothetical protein BJI67_12335 [Acidihalobacter aeolianus]|uniref:Uncharacterized protein n=2 Tax=Acidihalobacter aeolianus TaxID=2792603 RepID=A0A1D8K9W4_9GAMM|nr:hypothetical protein BJI67_12335 [Acidihalobacter aeolianus]